MPQSQLPAPANGTVQYQLELQLCCLLLRQQPAMPNMLPGRGATSPVRLGVK